MDSPDSTLTPVPFGRPMRETHFLLSPDYNPLNHGSFGTYPKHVQQRLHHVQALSEARPDVFILYNYPRFLDDSRLALAEFMDLPVEELVLVPNASMAINVVLQNLVFERGDVIVHFSTVYGAVEKAVEYLKETTAVGSLNVELEYSVEDDEVVGAFREAIKGAKVEGKRVRIAVFDTITSMPGVRVPWERLCEVCRQEGVLSLVDAAHGVGYMEMGIKEADPDFLVSNLHK